ncbi:hypothetical protein PAXRUDRAFT_824800 [Paxillus rubicundulus Ve08.2h10]|uniref:Peptide-O-fucosyltransferase n=1 Tax=Paxillus rubicundulus Ve08.2h10 TaxID=930991 RepID=A0A0D0EBF8_9AGAM|nr:hypothetical protein PAXRUDRAFT_824800 [Paxillus rubicundulus Ve08.2h10]
MAKESSRRESSEEFLLETPHHRDDDAKEPYRPSLSSPSSNTLRKKLVIAFSLVAAIPLLALVFLSRPSLTQQVFDAPVALDLDLKSYVVGPPTQSFRDNLRNDTKYITSWISAGWTNDVMTYGNLLYLAIITGRVPIIPKFIPSHVGGDTPPIAFGDVFDVAQLQNALGIPILEWHQVKDVDSQNLDDLGCWSVWEAVQHDEQKPRGSFLTDWLKLDISYTRAPDWVKLSPPAVEDRHGSFWSLATLAFPEQRTNSLLQPPYPSPEHQVSLPPDDQLLCYDYLYYIGAERPWEWELDYSPAWRFVGQHMRWTSTLENLADTYARRAMGIPDDEPTPAFISIHIRHGDFRVYCNDIPEDQCFAPLPVIARRVSEVQQELRERKGIDVTRVIITSDERDPNWWSEVRNFGWTWIDYAAERTVETHGKWYPVLIDAILQSNGAGFVGTYGSTMSTLARRRVETWHDGPTRLAKWGYPGADDH